AYFSLAQPITVAVGKPRTTSTARFGPDKTATGFEGESADKISLIRIPLPCSIPFVQLSNTAFSLIAASRTRVAISRRAVDGVTKTIRSASLQSLSSCVALTLSGNRTPGRYSVFSRELCTRLMRAALLPQSETGRL